MAWRRSAMSQKPVPHSINNKLEDTKAEKCGQRLIMSVNSCYAYQLEKKKDKIKPKREGPFIIDKVLTGGAYHLRNAADNQLKPNPWNAARLRRFYA